MKRACEQLIFFVLCKIFAHSPKNFKRFFFVLYKFKKRNFVCNSFIYFLFVSVEMFVLRF